MVIDVTGSPAGLYGGSSATVSIITKELQNVIVVPTTAISYAASGTTVTLDTNGTKTTRTVDRSGPRPGATPRSSADWRSGRRST